MFSGPVVMRWWVNGRRTYTPSETFSTSCWQDVFGSNFDKMVCKWEDLHALEKFVCKWEDSLDEMVCNCKDLHALRNLQHALLARHLWIQFWHSFLKGEKGLYYAVIHLWYILIFVYTIFKQSFPLFVFKHFFFLSSLWYNCHGWLNIKNQLSICPSSIIFRV